MASKFIRNPKLKYTKFGSSDMIVSEVCAGSMTWGSFNDKEEDAHAQLDKLLELGVNFYDTAELYPVGWNYGKVTEKWIGNWIQKKIMDGLDRNDMYIATKVNPAGIGGNKKNHYFSELDVIQSCRDSIERLKIDHIDLYYLHWPTRHVINWGSATQVGIVGMDGVLPKGKDNGDRKVFISQVKTIGKLFELGLIKNWGLSNEKGYGITMFCTICDELGVPRPVCLQNDFSLLNRLYEGDTLEACYRFGVVGCPYGALCGGTLTGKYLSDKKKYSELDSEVRELSECRHRKKGDFQPRYGCSNAMKASGRYVEIAEKHGLTPCTLALAWSNSRWYNSSVIIGTTTVRQVVECVNAFTIELSKDILEEIDLIHEEHRNPACYYSSDKTLYEAAWLAGSHKAASELDEELSER